jgi:hypothetical protein
MTILVSLMMGVFCAMPILIGRYANPVAGAFGAFIGGFLVALPVSGFAATIIYIILNYFIVQFILIAWLLAFCFLNHMETDYLINNKRLVGNFQLALVFAILVYAFYRSVTV